MKQQASAPAEQSQQRSSFGQAAQRGWQAPAAPSSPGVQLKPRADAAGNRPSVLPPEPVGDSSEDGQAEPQQETPFGSIDNRPRLVDQNQQTVPLSVQPSPSKTVQRLIRKDVDDGVELYHSPGWKYDLDHQITAAAGRGATQGDAGVTEVRETLASWLDADYVNLEQASADTMTWLVQNNFAAPGAAGVDIPDDAEVDGIRDLLDEYGKVYTYQAYTVVQDDPTIIPHPRELVRTASDLRGAGGAVGDYRADFVCVLLSLWPDNNAGAANWANNANKSTQLASSAALRQWLQAQHEAYLGDDVEYDQSPFFNRVLGTSGKSLIFSGETPWSGLAAAAGLVADREYIIVTDNHCMRIHYRGGAAANAYNVLNFDLGGQRGHEYAANTNVVMVWR